MSIYQSNDEMRLKPTNDEKLLSMLIYLTSFVSAIIAPLLIWLLKRDDSEFIDFHGKEFLNFVISFTIYSIVSSVLILAFIGFIILPIVAITGFVLPIIAAVKSYNGEKWRIPFIFRFIK